jgi:prepilin signal peptidase PulO-like enzyme (type II secretory pathway)
VRNVLRIPQLSSADDQRERHVVAWEALLATAGALAIGAVEVHRGHAPISVAMTAGFGTAFVLLAAHDIVYRVIPNRVVYPAVLLALSLSWAWEGRRPGDALVGGAVAFASVTVLRWLTRGGLGGGDLKMAGLVGLVVGYSNLPVAATVMVLAGGVSALALLAIGRLSRRGSIAYGPFIALGGLVALLK